MIPVETLNTFLSLLVVGVHVALAAALLLVVVGKKEPSTFLPVVMRNNLLLIAALVATVGFVGGIYYSSIIGYEVCFLCWYQRIFIFSQVPLLWLAVWKRDYRVASYSLILSVIGLAIGLYHYVIQFTGSSVLPCAASATEPSCLKLYFLEFGYVTFPMFSVTIFLALIGLMLLLRRENRG